MRYPTGIVTDEGWGRIHEGHGLDRQLLAADAARELSGDAVIAVSEVWLTYHPRIKWCERYDGWGCDQAGDWHNHWFECRPSPGAAFTLVHPVTERGPNQ